MSSILSSSPSVIHQVRALMHLGVSEMEKKNIDLGLKYFHEASALVPDDPVFCLDLGLSLSHFGRSYDRKDILLLANKKFKSIAQHPAMEKWQLWHSWGVNLSYLGAMTGEFHYFIEAEKKGKKALSMSSKAPLSDLAGMATQYACVRAKLAKHSKEAYDWRVALQAFEKVVQLSVPMQASFWNEFGFAYLELADLIVDIKLYSHAIHCFKNALLEEPKNLLSLQSLCSAMQRLYLHTQDEDHMAQARQCFETWTRLSSSPQPYLEWAVFLLQTGLLFSQTSAILECIKNCEIAHSLGLQDNPFLLATWGEALVIIGLSLEDIHPIEEGQEKIEQALTWKEEEPSFWRALGRSFFALGIYFDDLNCHYLSIEKLQTGLCLDRTQDTLWEALGWSYMHTAALIEDLAEYKKALYFYQKALDLRPYVGKYHYAKACCLSRMGEMLRQESYLSQALAEFEQAVLCQKHAVHIHPDWLFEYAKTLDIYADFFEEESYYHKAIDLFLHLLVEEPTYPGIYHRIAITYSHLGELSKNPYDLHRAVYFFKLALKKTPEEDQSLVDCAIALIHLSKLSLEETDKDLFREEAQRKLMTAMQVGNSLAYYPLACLYSLNKDTEKSMLFLRKAQAFLSLPPMEELLEDEWLDYVRASSEFKHFLQELERKIPSQEDV